MEPFAIAGLVSVFAVIGVIVSQLPVRAPTGDRDHGIFDLSPPNSTAGPTRRPQAPPVGIDDRISAWYADGVPSAISGEPVMRPGDVATRLGAGMRDTLLGGWARIDPAGSCLAPFQASPATIDPNRCRLLSLSETPNGPSVISFQPPAGFAARDKVVVIRIGAPDIAPALVTTVDPSFLATRSVDGIPKSIDGRPVLRVSEIGPHVARATDDTPFLVGGWLTSPGRRDCLVYDRNLMHPLQPRCGTDSLSDSLGGFGLPLIADTPLPQGPVILRVHVHDSRAATCSAPVTCTGRVVVEAVEWSGDSWTATEPWTIIDAMDRLDRVRHLVPFASIEPFGRDPDRRCDAGIPPQAWQATGGIRIGRIFVYATTAERGRFEGLLGSGGLSARNLDGSPCNVFIDSAFASRWIAADNLLVEVRVGHEASASDDALVVSITRALRAEP